MCGIAGIFRIGRASDTASEHVAAAMAGLIAHRGPDEGRVWCDSRGRVALGKVLMLQL